MDQWLQLVGPALLSRCIFQVFYCSSAFNGTMVFPSLNAISVFLEPTGVRMERWKAAFWLWKRVPQNPDVEHSEYCLSEIRAAFHVRKPHRFSFSASETEIHTKFNSTVLVISLIAKCWYMGRFTTSVQILFLFFFFFFKVLSSIIKRENQNLDWVAAVWSIGSAVPTADEWATLVWHQPSGLDRYCQGLQQSNGSKQSFRHLLKWLETWEWSFATLTFNGCFLIFLCTDCCPLAPLVAKERIPDDIWAAGQLWTDSHIPENVPKRAWQPILSLSSHTHD